MIADNWSDLTDGVIATPINQTEMRATVATTSSVFVYSNTKIDGNRAQAVTSQTCDNWSKETDPDTVLLFGKVGDIRAVDNNWTNTYVSLCADEHHLYCVEQ